MADDDLLIGAKEIARHLGRNPTTIEHWVKLSRIPVFRMGGNVCATKSGLAAYFAGQMLNAANIRQNSPKQNIANSGKLSRDKCDRAQKDRNDNG